MSDKMRNVVSMEKYRPVTVRLVDFTCHKVQLIKLIKEKFDLGLAVAKEIVESAPCDVGTFRSAAEAERFKAMLEDAGAVAEIRQD